MPHIDSYDLLRGLILFVACYFVLGDLIEDMVRSARKSWRRTLYGEEDLESRNVGFRLRVNRARFRQGVSGRAPRGFLKRPGAQLNPTGDYAPGAASRAFRQQEKPDSDGEE